MYDYLTGEEQAIKLLDELICLFSLYEKDGNILDECYKKIAGARINNPDFPVTLFLYNKLKEKGMIEE